jgi:pilus assembly protein CpaC
MKGIAVFLVAIVLVATVAALAQDQPASGAKELIVMSGKSVVVESPANIERVAVANGDIAEAVVATPREVLINGKAPGETSLVVWQQGGNRLFFDVMVQRHDVRLDAARQELTQEPGTKNVSITEEGDAVFVNGTVDDLTSADRAMAIAGTLGNGKPVNLLRVNVPPTDSQIVLKVRFADVDRTALQQLGVNFFSTGTGNTIGRTTTGQFSSPGPSGVGGGQQPSFTLSDALNVFLFRTDLNLGAVIKALQSKNALEILAEPNVLAINGRPASFLAGGEFPYPTLQGGAAGVGQITIQFREFGVRLNFIPVVTPRGTIRLAVTPEVSSLDFANGLVFQGFTIPALNTRRIQTEIELEDGQSFAIAGLLDRRTTQTLSKIPGLGDIPLLGKLFHSREVNKTNTELLVLVTPEIVHPIQKGAPLPELKFPVPFLEPDNGSAVQTPGAELGPAAQKPAVAPIPVEQLMKSQKPLQSGGQDQTPPVQFVPIPVMPAPQPTQPPPAATPISPGATR